MASIWWRRELQLVPTQGMQPAQAAGMRLHTGKCLDPGCGPGQHKTHEKDQCGRTAHGGLLEDSLRG